MNNSFTEDDKNKVIELLNFIAKRAVFPDWKTEDTIKHFKLLAHLQTVILPKIEANIFEMGAIIKADSPVSSTERE